LQQLLDVKNMVSLSFRSLPQKVKKDNYEQHYYTT